MSALPDIRGILVVLLLGACSCELVLADGTPSKPPDAPQQTNAAALPAKGTVAPLQVPGGLTSAATPTLTPEELLATAQSYIDQTEAMRSGLVGAAPAELAAMRPLVMLPWLKALKLLIDNGVTREFAPFPKMTLYDGPGEGPMYEEYQKLSDQEQKAAAEARKQEALVVERKDIEANVVGYYANPPFATDEFQRIAKEAGLSDVVVQDLVSRIGASIKAWYPNLSPATK